MNSYLLSKALILSVALLNVNPTSAFAQSISPPDADVPPGGGGGTVTVTAASGKVWTVTSSDSWIQIVAPASGTGTGAGTVEYKVLPDSTLDVNHVARTGTLTIAGTQFAIRQHRNGQISYTTWSAQLPEKSRGPNQDASGNGIPNLVKYAFGLDSLKPGNGSLPKIAVHDKVVTYSLTKPKSVVGVRYTVRVANELGASVVQNLTLSKVSETAESETWQATVAGDNPTKFEITTLVQVGVTSREVQALIEGSFNTVDRNLALWNIQPGLGTVMIEYGRRIAMVNQAVQAGDWGMAQYQLKEATEIQEVGEITRPQNAALLKNFEASLLDPISKDILAKDKASFQADYASMIEGCNACHQATGHPYVYFRKPTVVPEDFLVLGASEPIPPTASPTPAAVAPVSETPLTWSELLQSVDAAFDGVNTSLALWGIQPGLGTVMMEYGKRFALAKFAADAGDWGMAQYQITEATEIQEVGETTRPKNTPLLKNFEHTLLDPLQEDIQRKDLGSFQKNYSAAIEGCNACHQATGHGYVRVQIPPTSPEPFLQFGPSEPVVKQTTPPAATPPPADMPSTAPTVADAQKLISDRLNNLDRNHALWNIQPGLGTVMMEYGYRFALAGLAADAGNWGMAEYQIKEATEIQEVGEITRPKNAPLLKNFEQSLLVPLQNDIKNKDLVTFKKDYDTAIQGCNACHQATGHGYVRVQLPPATLTEFLNMAGAP
jgi:cytochrome c553